MQYLKSLTILFLSLIAACGSDGGGSDPGIDAGGTGGTDGGDGPVQEPPGPLAEGAATLAGGPISGRVDGDRNSASFNNPVNVEVGPDGNIYVADFDNGLLRVITPQGTVSTLAPAEADFSRPFGLAFTPDGSLYVQTDRDTGGQLSGALWRVDTQTGEATLVEDTVGRMRGLAALPDGRLVMAEYQKHVIVVIDPATGVVNTIAGAYDQIGNTDGVGEAARFNIPYDLVLHPDGYLVVADYGNNQLRRIDLNGNGPAEVTTLAGTGMAGVVDDTLAAAEFNQPQGLAVDDAGMLYVTDSAGFVIRRVDLAADSVTTIAGTGEAGFRDDENPLAAQFYGLEGIAVDDAGTYLYVADGSRGEDARYHRVRRVSLP